MSKILIVDDEEMTLMPARFILSSKYEIVTATSGTEAIEIFEREKPDMILSDLLMPEMDGYELHRRIQERSKESVPIMFMTADDSGESESKGFELGAADYISKPLKPDVLLRRVGNIMDNLEKIHKLEVAATTDPLTGLLNKSASQDEIGACVKNSSGALMMIDLDSFKLVNDLYGHSCGDKILIHFAALIRKIIREDDLAGRMGGDEFIAFLRNVDDEKILRNKVAFLNEQLLTVAKNLLGDDMSIPLGTSCGAVFVPDEGTDFQTLYKKADGALYDVKQHGKHGLAIFGEHTAADSSKKISQMRLILGERNHEAGAFFVDFETFKKIYQFLVRTGGEFAKGATLLQFTLSDEKFADEFKEILVHSLRRSDCVTQHGKNFLILLLKTTAAKSEVVREKIFSRLEKSFADKISFETETVFGD